MTKLITDKNHIILPKKLQKEGYQIFKNGWPDLLTVKNKELRFIEIKEEGKGLRDEQIGMMQALSDNGLSCFIWYPKTGLINFKDYFLYAEKRLKYKGKQV